MHRIASMAVGAALLALAVSLTVLLASSANAGDGGTSGVPAAPAGPAAPVAPATEPSLRQSAVDAAIHQLERHLATLRKTRTDLHAGRAEAAPSDDDARRLRELDVRGMREVVRYEASRAKALAAVSTAAAAADAAKATEAQAAVEAADKRFVESMKKLDDERDNPKTAKSGDGKSSKTGDSKSGDSKSGDEKPRRSGHPTMPPTDDED
jgi:hypothetical protein